MSFEQWVFTLSGIIWLAILVWREVSNYFEVKFYRDWSNKLLEKNTGTSIFKVKDPIESRPLTDEEEALLEEKRLKNKKDKH